MKKTLLSLLAITAITTTIWADISEEQLDTYMKASGANVMLENMQKQLGEGIKMQVQMQGNTIPPQVIEAITAVMVKEENLAKFTSGIKGLDEKYYKEIIKFYDTNLGKKSADIVRNMDIAKMQQGMMDFSKKELSKERKVLVNNLIEATMSEKRSEKMARTMMKSTLNAMPKAMQETISKQMEAQMEQMKPMMKKQMELSTGYMYRDYSDKELKTLTTYYKTNPAQAEIEATIEGSSDYMQTVMPQVMNVLTLIKEKKTN